MFTKCLMFTINVPHQMQHEFQGMQNNKAKYIDVVIRLIKDFTDPATSSEKELKKLIHRLTQGHTQMQTCHNNAP